MECPFNVEEGVAAERAAAPRQNQFSRTDGQASRPVNRGQSIGRRGGKRDKDDHSVPSEKADIVCYRCGEIDISHGHVLMRDSLGLSLSTLHVLLVVNKGIMLPHAPRGIYWLHQSLLNQRMNNYKSSRHLRDKLL